jgi:predicted SAM-dependent methyltransferase
MHGVATMKPETTDESRPKDMNDDGFADICHREDVIHQQVPDVSKLESHEFVDLAYQVILGREIEPRERDYHAARLDTWQANRFRIVAELFRSGEFVYRSWDPSQFWDSGHRARMLVASMLPKASTIVDLGGSCKNRPEGALIVFGYPYKFQNLSIVELPREQRHELYSEICGEYGDSVSTKQGLVSYVYSSMTDLSHFPDGSVDLVYSGQSIEHVTRAEADLVFQEVRRILKQGGAFCFDTPNRRVTKLGYPDGFVVDDHKYEYTHTEMTAMLEQHGFRVLEAKGLVLMSRSVEEGRYIIDEARGRDRIYDDIEDCFLLYYRAQKL